MSRTEGCWASVHALRISTMRAARFTHLTLLHYVISFILLLLLLLSISMSLEASVGAWRNLQFLILVHSRLYYLSEWSTVTRLRPTTYTHDNITRNIETQTPMPWVRYEPTTPLLERPNAVPTTDNSITVSGCILLLIFALRMSESCRTKQEYCKSRIKETAKWVS
jgi:hypothetical protein